MEHNNTPWLVQHIRTTVFPLVGEEIDSGRIFDSVIGDEPDELKRNREKRREELEIAKDDSSIRLILQPGRIHWYRFPKQREYPGDSAFVSLGRLEDEIEDWNQLSEHWFASEHFPEIDRLAFGTVLLVDVDSREDGYAMLTDLIPSLDLDVETTSDLLYQINRWRNLEEGVPGLKVNRLAKWSVARRHAASMSVSATGLEPMEEEVSHAVRLEIDISTDSENEDELPYDELPTIFDELTHLALEISNDGDIR